MSATRRVHVVISGRVQGVWYRGSMEDRAVRLGLAGWVRNLPDGDVEAVIEGPSLAVDELLAWCRRGPSGARVQSVRSSEEPAQGLTDFRIVR